MNNEYHLISLKIVDFKLIDRIVANNIKEATREFKRRNDFEKLNQRYGLRIAKTERYF